MNKNEDSWEQQFPEIKEYIQQALDKQRSEIQAQIDDGFERVAQSIREGTLDTSSPDSSTQGETHMPDNDDVNAMVNPGRDDARHLPAHVQTTNLDYVVATAQSAAALWPSRELRQGPAQFALFLPALVALADKGNLGELKRPDAGERVAVPALFGGAAWVVLRLLNR